MPQTIPAGGFYQCTFSANVNGNAGYSETDIVTATGASDDGNTGHGQDDATVTLTNVPSSIRVTKTANPTTVPEPAAPWSSPCAWTTPARWTAVTITSLIDSIHGNLNGKGTCAVPQTIPAGGFYQCTFTANVNGSAGYSRDRYGHRLRHR